MLWEIIIIKYNKLKFLVNFSIIDRMVKKNTLSNQRNAVTVVKIIFFCK